MHTLQIFNSIHVFFFLVVLVFSPFKAYSSSVADMSVSQPVKLKAPETQSLISSDCKKCHPHIVRINSKNGMAHVTSVSCVDCHEGHPPMKRQIIPRCSQCHVNTPHFDLDNCQKCHTNPHTPLEISLTKTITFECTTCHTRQYDELTNYTSIHTTLDCTACHTRHGYVPKCFQCHAPHLETMTNSDCLTCHKAHMPLIVNYPEETPSDFCGSCHTDVYGQLAQSRSKHRQVACVACHEDQHKNIPECKKCHSQPHPAPMLKNYSNCGICHGKAHLLKLNYLDLSIERQKSM